MTKRKLDSRAFRMEGEEAVSFMTDLYSSKIGSREVSVVRECPAGENEKAYGEIMEKMMEVIFTKLALNETDVVVDLGSGVGSVVLFAALYTKVAKAYGIETVPERAELADVLAAEFRKRVAAGGLECSPFELHYGDFRLEDFEYITKEANVFIMNAVAFDDVTMRAIFTLIRSKGHGTRIVSTKCLDEIRSGEGRNVYKRDDGNPSMNALLTCFKFSRLRDAVSWTNGERVQFYLYTVDYLACVPKLINEAPYWTMVKAQKEPRKKERVRRKKKKTDTTQRKSSVRIVDEAEEGRSGEEDEGDLASQILGKRNPKYVSQKPKKLIVRLTEQDDEGDSSAVQGREARSGDQSIDTLASDMYQDNVDIETDNRSVSSDDDAFFADLGSGSALGMTSGQSTTGHSSPSSSSYESSDSSYSAEPVHGEEPASQQGDSSDGNESLGGVSVRGGSVAMSTVSTARGRSVSPSGVSVASAASSKSSSIEVVYEKVTPKRVAVKKPKTYASYLHMFKKLTRWNPSPSYDMIGNLVVFTGVAKNQSFTGSGQSRRAAERAAAQNALKKWYPKQYAEAVITGPTDPLDECNMDASSHESDWANDEFPGAARKANAVDRKKMVAGQSQRAKTREIRSKETQKKKKE